jgi:hypothetical protein
MSETGIGVYIPDPSHGELAEGEVFRKSLEAEYDVPFRFVSIGRGAAVAAFMADLIAFAESPTGVVAGGLLAAFFAGEKIEKNLDAWKRLYQRLKSTFHHKPTFDREGAAVLVQNEIAKKLDEEPRSILCRGFEIVDRLSLINPMEIPEPKHLDVIGPPADKVAISAVYYFEVKANDRLFLARVEGENVLLIEIGNPQ